jgi:hypothetical protein
MFVWRGDDVTPFSPTLRQRSCERVRLSLHTDARRPA